MTYGAHACHVQGTRKSTVYRWDFNDSTPAVEVTGFDLAQTQVHTFARPGVFYVKVLKTNEAGTFEATVAVSVLGKCAISLFKTCNDLLYHMMTLQILLLGFL